jgi:hypothetical protein
MWLALAAIQVIPASAAFAQSASYVAANGNDSNACTSDAPCLSIGRALTNTIASGEVLIVGSPLLASANITKAVTIRALDGKPEIFASNLNISAGASDKIVLIGLSFFSGSTHFGTTSGIQIRSAGDVIVRDCVFNGYQLQFGGYVTGGIVLVNTAPVRMTISNSFFTNNLVGVSVQSSPSMGHVKISNSTFESNVSSGIHVEGSGNDVSLTNVQILTSPKALDLVSGGIAKSYGNNVINAGDAPVKMPLN